VLGDVSGLFREEMPVPLRGIGRVAEELAEHGVESPWLLEVDHVRRSLEDLQSRSGNGSRQMPARLLGARVVERPDDHQQWRPQLAQPARCGGSSGCGVPSVFSAW